MQKSKYEQQIKTNSKKQVHPRDSVFDMEMAKQLILGTFHKDEDDEEMVDIKLAQVGDDGKQVLNRAMMNFKNQPAEEI